MELYSDQIRNTTVDMANFPNKTASGYNLQRYGCDILKGFFCPKNKISSPLIKTSICFILYIHIYNI